MWPQLVAGGIASLWGKTLGGLLLAFPGLNLTGLFLLLIFALDPFAVTGHTMC